MENIPTKADKFEITGQFYGRCVKVYDGDTIHVIAKPMGFDKYYKFACRLARINAPEIRGGDENSRAAAATSRDVLAAKILNKVVRVDAQGAEKYGRVLSEITLDDENINDYMLSNGHAKLYGEK